MPAALLTDLHHEKAILLVEDSKVQKLARERVLFKAGYLVLFAGGVLRESQGRNEVETHRPLVARQ